MKKISYEEFDNSLKIGDNTFIVSRDNKKGIYHNMSMIVPCECDICDFGYQGSVKLVKDGKHGFYRDGKIIPIIYDRIDFLEDNLYLIEQKGKKGIYNIDLKVEFFPCKYDSIRRINNRYFLKIKDNSYIYNLAGEKLFGKSGINIEVMENNRDLVSLNYDNKKTVFDLISLKELEIDSENYLFYKKAENDDILIAGEKGDKIDIYINGMLIVSVDKLTYNITFDSQFIYLNSKNIVTLIDIQNKKIVSDNVKVITSMNNLICIYDKVENTGIKFINNRKVIYCNDESIAINFGVKKLFFIQENLKKLYVYNEETEMINAISDCKSINNIINSDILKITTTNGTIRFINSYTGQLVDTEFKNIYNNSYESIFNKEANNENIDYFLDNNYVKETDYSIVQDLNNLYGVIDNKINLVFPCIAMKIGKIICEYVSFSADGRNFGVFNLKTSEFMLKPIYKKVYHVDDRFVVGVNQDDTKVILNLISREVTLIKEEKLEITNFYDEYNVSIDDIDISKTNKKIVLPIIEECSNTDGLAYVGHLLYAEEDIIEEAILRERTKKDYM